MHYKALSLLTAASSAYAQSYASTPVSSSASTSTTSIGAVKPIGAVCVPNVDQCALGADCYAVNSMLQTICGNFQASCTSDQQCAFNTCNTAQGLCNGLLSSSSSASATATITGSSTGSYSGAPSSTVTAPAGSLPLGAECDATKSGSANQCISGIQCWASNAGLIARCGNFNAACSSNAQCAYNTCNNGLCSGLLPSGAGNATMTVMPTGTYSTGVAGPTNSVIPYTGAAPAARLASGVLAVVFAAVAWAM